MMRSAYRFPKWNRFWLLVVLVLCGTRFSWALKATDFEARTYTDANGKTLPYRLFIPRNYDPKQSYPLVLFLHGAGERGKDNKVQVSQNERLVFADEKHQAQHPCFFLAPQCPATSWWTGKDFVIPNPADPPAEPLRLAIETLESVEKEFNVDLSRVYVTGLSMGGFATWDALARYPDRFAAGVPIAGVANVNASDTISRTPIWAFHGDADTTVPTSGTRNIINRLWDNGHTPRYTEYPGVGHDSWTGAYKEPLLAGWLFSQHLDTTMPSSPSGLKSLSAVGDA